MKLLDASFDYQAESWDIAGHSYSIKAINYDKYVKLVVDEFESRHK